MSKATQTILGVICLFTLPANILATAYWYGTNGPLALINLVGAVGAVVCLLSWWASRRTA